MVFHAAQHQRAAVARRAGAQLVGREPQGAHDAVVQRAAGQRLADAAAEGDAQVGDVVAGGRPVKAREIDADQAAGRERPRGLFQHLAHHRLGQRFAGVQVARRVVQAQAFAGFLFDDEEAAGVLDDGGDGDAGLPAGGGRGHERMLGASVYALGS